MTTRSDDFSELTAAFAQADPEPEGSSDPPRAPDDEVPGPQEGASESVPPDPETDAEPPAPPDDEAPGPARASRWSRFVVPAVVLLLVASNITFAFLLLRGGIDRHERAVAAVAERFTTNLVTFNFRTLDADIQRIQQDATGTFQRQFDTALGGDVAVFREAIQEAQAESSGTIRGVTVTEVDGENATALVVAEQTIRNRETPDPRSVLRVIELSLVQTADGWKVNDVSTLGGEDLG